MKGWRTLLSNFVMFIVPAFLTWVVGIDWTQYVSPNTALMIVTMGNVALRMVTTTAIFKRK